MLRGQTLVFSILIILTLVGSFSIASSLDLNLILKERNTAILNNPERYYPHLSDLDKVTLGLLNEESTCFHNDSKRMILWGSRIAGQEVAQKYFNWLNHYCGFTKELPQDFFALPPFIHPLGKSWVMRAYQSGRDPFQSHAWLESHAKWTHILESRELLLENLDAKTQSAIRDLNSDQWQALLLEKPIVKSSQIIWQRDVSKPGLVYFLQTSWLYEITQPPYFLPSLSLFLILLLGLILWQFWSGAKTRQRYQLDKELMMQTIAHELRHPVTSLQLSLEVFRAGYDQLSQPNQNEFFRMAGQVQRLHRIIHASRQYLLAQRDSGKKFQFRAQEIKSIDDFLSDILADYEQKIEQPIQRLETSLVTDPYWFSVCVLNLVKNALIHGKPPIKVEYRKEADRFFFSVTDAGNLQKTLDELIVPFQKGEESQGLGLGLSIVARIVTLMNGKFECSIRPTNFRFSIKEMKNA